MCSLLAFTVRFILQLRAYAHIMRGKSRVRRVEHGIPLCAGNCRKMESLCTDGAAILRPGAHPRRAKAGKILGHPRGCRETPGPSCRAQTRERSATLWRVAGPYQSDAPDEHVLSTGAVFGGGRGHGSRSSERHCHGRIPLLQRLCGRGGPGN